jgi:hypothetical protein
MWTLKDFKFNYFGKPLLSNESIQIFNDTYSEFNNGLEYIYKTGTVISGILSDSNGNTYNLKDYEKYYLIFSCNQIGLLYSRSQPVQFLISHDLYHTSCFTPYAIDESASFLSTEKGTGRSIQFIDINLHNSNPIFDNYFNSEFRINTQVNNILFEGGQNIYEPEFLSENVLIKPQGLPANVNIYMVDNTDSLQFISFSPEGFPSSYEYILPFPRVMNNTEYNITISLENGDKFTNTYSLRDLTDCKSSNIVDQTNVNDFTVIGTAFDGSNIYIKKDIDDPYLNDLYAKYLEDDTNISNEINEDDSTYLKYDEFLKLYPTIYWQTPFNKMIRLVRKDIFSSEICGPGI